MRLLTGQEPPPEALLSPVHARVRASDVYGQQPPDGTVDLIIRASFRCRISPMGEWVVFDGMRIAPDNSWRPYTSDELSEAW